MSRPDPRSALDAAGEQAADEVALQAEENDQRDDDREEPRRRQQVPVRSIAPTGVCIRAVTDGMSRLVPPNVLATSRSFHTHRNWKIPNEAIAGIDNGSTIDRKIRRCEAPSTQSTPDARKPFYVNGNKVAR